MLIYNERTNCYYFFKWQLLFWNGSLNYTLKEIAIAHHLFFLFFFFLNAKSFSLNFPKKISRKGHSELLLLGSFPGCSQALPPCSLLLSWMLNVCQPLTRSLFIWWKGWLPLRHSRVLFVCPVSPAAWESQQRSEEKRSSRIEFSASSCSGSKIPQSRCLLSLSWLQH